MGKKARVVPQRRPTKRQLSRWQREKQAQRLILVAGAAVILLVLAIPIFGFAREIALKGQEPIARVNQSVLRLSEYAQILGLRSYLLEAQSENLQRVSGQAGDQLQLTLQALERARISLPNEVVEDWISEQLIREEAVRQGLAVTPSEVTDSIRPEFDPATPPGEDPKPIPEEEFQSRYRDFLSRARTSDALYRRMKEFTLLAEKLESRLQEQVPLAGPQVHLQAILVATEEDAKSVESRLDNGEDFAQVAKEVSLDSQSKDKGGDIGWVPHGLLETEIEVAAFSMEVGQVKGPIEAAQGYYALKLLEREEAREIEASNLEKLKSGTLYRWLRTAQENAKIERDVTSDKIDWAEKQTRRR